MDARDDEDAPLDPAVERVRRRMMRLMAVSVAIMMTGLIAVIGAIVYKFSARDGGAAALRAGETLERRIGMPKDARVVGGNLSGGDLLMTIDPGGGRQLQFWIYRIAEDRVVAKLAVE
jgi:hypothetical protein